MRHAGEVGEHRFAADVLAERQGQALAGFLERLGAEQLAQIHGLAPRIGQLDADGVAARHHRHAGGYRAHRAGDVVGEADDAGGLYAGRRLELVEGDDGTGMDVDDLAAHPEIVEHAFEGTGVLLQGLIAQIFGAAEPPRFRSAG